MKMLILTKETYIHLKKECKLQIKTNKHIFPKPTDEDCWEEIEKSIIKKKIDQCLQSLT